MRKWLALLAFGVLTAAGSAQTVSSRPAPGLIADIQNPTVMFVDMLDAARCLSLTPDNCDTIKALSGTYDVSKWIGTLLCNPAPSMVDCADCFTHVDGVNIVGVLPVVREELREPWYCHSLCLPNIYNHDLKNQILPSSVQVPKLALDMDADILPFAGATAGRSSAMSPQALLQLPVVSEGDFAAAKFENPRPGPLQYWNTAVVVYGQQGSQFAPQNRPDPALPAAWQTLGSQNQAQNGVETVPVRLPSSLFAAGTDNYKLCGVYFDVKELGSVHPDALEGLAHNLLTLNGRTLSSLGGQWETATGQYVGEQDADFNTVSGLWRCNAFHPFGLDVPPGAPTP